MIRCSVLSIQTVRGRLPPGTSATRSAKFGLTRLSKVPASLFRMALQKLFGPVRYARRCPSEEQRTCAVPACPNVNGAVESTQTDRGQSSRLRMRRVPVRRWRLFDVGR